MITGPVAGPVAELPKGHSAHFPEGAAPEPVEVLPPEPLVLEPAGEPGEALFWLFGVDCA